MKFRGLFFLIFTTFVMFVYSQDLSIRTKDTELLIDNSGKYSSIKVCGKEILKEKSNVVLAGVDGKLVFPKLVKRVANNLLFIMSDNNELSLSVKEGIDYIRFDIQKTSKDYDMVLFGPLIVNINEVVGEVVGVSQGSDIAFGVQSMNAKTIVGLPYEYSSLIKKTFNYSGETTFVSVSSIPDYEQAVTKISDGAVFQFAAIRRDTLKYKNVKSLDGVMAMPVKGEDGLITGAAITLFGSKRSDILKKIEKIEISEDLPHPMIKGEWTKTSKETMKSYLISDFTEKTFEATLEKAERAGFDYIYHEGPFENWGHFNWSKSFSSNGDQGVKVMVEKASKKGIGVGIHTLSNFTTTNDGYVTPVPSGNLLKQGVLTLVSSIDEKQVDILVENSSLFDIPMSLNGLMIDNELISFTSIEKENNNIVLKNCKRGAWGTIPSRHDVKSPMYKLWDYPYKTFFPDLELQDKYADRLAEIINTTGICQISFDGLEGCTYTGHGEYAMAKFVERVYKQVDSSLRNDASRLTHYLWHIHSYVNWGEPWGETMRKGQVESRIVNQSFYRRNLFPRMLGWFLIRLADKKHECTSLEDLEWALSESAGFDAGYAMTIRNNTLNNHGQIDKLLDAIKNWDYLRENNFFTEKQKELLRNPETEWHLERKSDEVFLLFPLNISQNYVCSLSEMQPGQPGGADWMWTTPYGGEFAVRLKVDGDGVIRNPQFNTQNGVIKFPCEISDKQYLLYTFDGKAVVTDKNYNIIQTVQPEGNASLPAGTTTVAFSCELVGDEIPDIVVKHITRGTPEKIMIGK